MAIPVNEQYIAELTRSLGEAYISVKRGVGSNTTPGTALFELSQLSSLAAKDLPKFGLLSSEVLDAVEPFEVTWDEDNSDYVTVGAGYVGYNFNNTPQKVLVYTQNVAIKKAFSPYYTTSYRYGVRIGLPLSEIQKATQSYSTSLTAAAETGDQYISVADMSIADQLGFPLKATVGNAFVIFSDYSEDGTKLKVDPSFNGGSGFVGSIPAASRVYFIYEARVLSVIGLPISPSVANTYDPEIFPYMPPMPQSWLPIAEFVVTNPETPEIEGDPLIIRTTTLWPDPEEFSTDPPIFDDDDAATINRAAQAASGSIRALVGAASIGEAARALEDYTAELAGTNNISFRQYWGSRPFVGTSYFLRGVAFANIERFEFTDEFAEAYFDATRRDVQHTFAIFRGDAYARGYHTITPTLSPPSRIDLRSMISTAINSPFTRGSYIYGVSAVYANGESAPVYGSVVTNSNNTYYVNDIQFNAASPAPLFYNVYRRSSIVGEAQEWRITQPYDIIKPSQWNINVADTNPGDDNTEMNYLSEGIQFTAESTGCLGGVGLLLKASAELTNPTEYLTISLYTKAADPSVTPGTLITASSSTIPYSALTQSFKLFVVNFDCPLTELIEGDEYYIVISQSSAPTGGDIIIAEWSGTRTDIDGEAIADATTLHAYYNGSIWSIGTPHIRYYQLYGLIDNNITGYSLSHRGLMFTGRKANIPTRFRVYVPPIDPTTIKVGRVPGIVVAEEENDAALGTGDTDTRTVNDLVVTVTAKNSVTKVSKTFTVTVPQGTTRDTSFLLGTTTDLFDSIEDVQVVPGENIVQGPSGAIVWSIYDLITVETNP